MLLLLDLLALVILCAIAVRLMMEAHARAEQLRAGSESKEDGKRASPRSAAGLPGNIFDNATVTLWADPIDGMPFLPGEQVFACPCGTAYRLDSREWLVEHCKSRCVNCDADIRHQRSTVAGA